MNRDRALGRRRTKTKYIIEDVKKILRATGLCHDLGHFPLSHTFERAFVSKFMPKELTTDEIPSYGTIPHHFPKRASHEIISAEIVRQIIEKKGDVLEKWVGRGVILTILAPSGISVTYKNKKINLDNTMFFTLNAIIMGDYDADRLDYLQRDGYLSGSGFGHFDIHRFIDAMVLIEEDGVYKVLPSSRALSSVEAALVERYKLYKWVYFHHKTLFFDEVCCEAAKKMLEDKSVTQKMFRKYGKVEKPIDYRKKILKALNSRKKIPPLILFHGRSIGLRNYYYELNPDFFIENSDSHFFDDVWFCNKFRKKKNFGAQGEFYIQALVHRQACGITLWKDLSEFDSFCESCNKFAVQFQLFTAKVGTLDVRNKLPSFLKNLWKLMREGDFADEICDRIVYHANKGLKDAGIRSLRSLVRIADWRLFGNLRGKKIVGKTGTPVYLIKHSILLDELSNLTGEIPFYAFIVGKSSDLEKIRKKKNKNILWTIMAKAFIKSIIDKFDLPAIKHAWTKAEQERS